MCSKRTFSKRKAEAILDRLRKRPRENRREVRTYWCEFHQGYHLTSQDYFAVVRNIKLRFKNKWKQLLKTG